MRILATFALTTPNLLLMKKSLFLSFFAVACFSAQAGQTPAQRDILPENNFSAFFEKAYQEHPSIPKGILEAVAFINTRFSHLTANESESCTGMPRAYGVMGLVADGKKYFQNNLHTVSSFSRFTMDELISSPEKNILAYADAYEQAQKYLLADSKVENQIPVLVFLSELPDDGSLENNFAMNTHLYSVLSFLNNSDCSEKYRFPQYTIPLEKIFGAENFKVLSASSVKIQTDKITDVNGNKYKFDNTIPPQLPTTSYQLPTFSSPDYPPALWNPAASCNYSSRGATSVSAVTIHTVQGSYAGAISWFQNCAASVSAHYVIRSSDGQITQMVLEADKGWHVGSENPYTIGIEHEGYVNNAAWYTTAMYQSSADLCKDICSSGYGINPLRTGFWPWLASTYYNQSSIPGSCTKIKGHMHYPNQSHTDPGPNWNWDYFFKLINTQPAPTTLTAATGNFYDSGGAGGNYSDDERLVWVISPASATSVTLTFSSFDLENTWDYIYVYDGTNVWAPLIGYYTGNINPGTLVANSGSMCVEFRSDCSTTAAGWNASWISNATTVTPTNLSVSPIGCPNDGVTLTWQNSSSNWYVDVSDDANFTWFWNKAVPNLTSTICPGTFCLYGSPCNPSDYLGFQPQQTYYWRIWDGTSHTYGNAFTTPNCIYMQTTCSGNFDDTGGPSAAYSGNEDYTTIIQPAFATSVTMTFTSFDLELNYDSLWIYDGLPNSALIGAYTGTASPGTITANTGIMSLRFKADPFVNNAGWTATWTCVSNVGINEQNNSDAVLIYPNPSNGKFRIYGLQSESQLLIYDVLGQNIFSKTVDGKEKIITLRAKSGIYFYKLENEKGTFATGKLVIE